MPAGIFDTKSRLEAWHDTLLEALPLSVSGNVNAVEETIAEISKT